MVRAVCSGSFDPVTNGHIDIFARASRMFDELIVCVFNNIRKQAMFSVEERVGFLREATGHLPKVRVDSFAGLITDYMKEHDAKVIVRGLRSISDFEYEQREAQVISHMDPEIDTIFFLTAEKFAYLSSSTVRELAFFGSDVHGLVPACVEAAIEKRKDEKGRVTW